jgi:hypothetical protein
MDLYCVCCIRFVLHVDIELQQVFDIKTKVFCRRFSCALNVSKKDIWHLWFREVFMQELCQLFKACIITFIWNCLCRNKEYAANFMYKFVHITNLFILNAYLSNYLKWSRCTSKWQRQSNFKLDEMFIIHICVFAFPLCVL